MGANENIQNRNEKMRNNHKWNRNALNGKFVKKNILINIKSRQINYWKSIKKQIGTEKYKLFHLFNKCENQNVLNKM